MAADPSDNPRNWAFDQTMYDNQTVKRFIEGKLSYIEVRGNIRDQCFYRCEFLKILYIPNTTTMGRYCVYICNNLTKMTCDNVTSMGTYCLGLLSSLQHLYLPKCTSLQTTSIYSCNSKATIHFGSVNESTIKATTWYKNNSSNYKVLFDL